MKRVVITLENVLLTFYEAQYLADIDPSWPYLLPFEQPRKTAWLGDSSLGDGEVSSMRIALINANNCASRILGYPTRAKVDVYDGQELIFTGAVQRVDYGPTMYIEAES